MTPAATRSDIAKAYLQFASAVIDDQSSTEGKLRSAISRSYYAVFLTVRDRLFGVDAQNLSYKGYGQLITKLTKKFQKKNRIGPHDVYLMAVTEINPASGLNVLTFYQQAEQLKKARVHADYDFGQTKLEAIPNANWLQYAKDNVQLADKLFRQASELPPF